MFVFYEAVLNNKSNAKNTNKKLPENKNGNNLFPSLARAFQQAVLSVSGNRV